MKTVSFNLSKELSDVAKGKGVQLPESYFIWVAFEKQNITKEWIFNGYEIRPRKPELPELIKYPHINAYAADEVLEFLPNGISDNDCIVSCGFQIGWIYGKTQKNGVIDRMYEVGYEDTIKFNDYSLADALCKLAIWLAEEGFIK